MSSEVKLYDPCETMPGAMRECEDGGFCQASDYAALEAENARLLAEVEEFDDLRKRQSELLSAAAIAIRGPEPALTRYSHADIPERVKMVVEDRDTARAQLAAIQGGMGEVVERFGPCSLNGTAYMEPVAAGGYVRARDFDRITAAMAAEVQTWKQLHADAQELYDDAMIAIGKELGIDVSDEPRCKHVSAQAMAMAAEVERLKLRLYDFEHGDLDYALKERDALRAELAEVKGREAVGEVVQTDSAGGRYSSNTMRSLPIGTKLYASPPASPDVEGLVKALEDCAGRLRLLIDSGRHKMLDAVAEEKAQTALSTWRQAQEGKA